MARSMKMLHWSAFESPHIFRVFPPVAINQSLRITDHLIATSIHRHVNLPSSTSLRSMATMEPRAISNTQDEEYDSCADSDFGGSLSPSSGDESSASDGEEKKGVKGKSLKKRSIEDSGDEGVVKEGKKKRRKKATHGHEADGGTEESAIGMRVRERKLGRAA